MSLEEFNLLKSGKTLENHTAHFIGHKTSSKGFCFFDENDCSPWYAFEFLSGIVSNEVCVRFKVAKKLLTESWGIYADPFYESWFDTITMREWCCESYNNKGFKILSYKYPKEEEWRFDTRKAKKGTGRNRKSET